MVGQPSFNSSWRCTIHCALLITRNIRRITQGNFSRVSIKHVAISALHSLSAMIPKSPSILEQVSHTFHTVFAELKHAFSVKPADCVFIVGPGNQGDVDFLKQHSAHSGLKVHFIGDGEHPVSKEMIQDARRKGIIGPNTEVICINHGINLKSTGNISEHRLQFSEDRPDHPKGVDRIPTIEVLGWLREPLAHEDPVNGAEHVWTGNIHFMACQIGSFKNQFSSQNDLWKHGQVILHGSSKVVATNVVQDNCAELIRQMAYLKKNELGVADPLETMRQLANHSVDTLTLLGGELEEAVVVHAPKTIPEFMPDHLQAHWRQQATEAKLESAMSIELDAAPKRPSKPLIKAPNQQPADTQQRQMVSYILTRLLHLKTEAKLKLLQSDLQKFPAIANLQLHLQRSPLSLICSYVYHGEREITATEIAKVLLDNGADIKALDMMGASALHYAAQRGEASLIELLVSRGADVNQRDKSGRGVLHWACALSGERKIAAVNALLKHCKNIDVNRADKKGFTPLHLAIMANDKELVDLLLKAGADPIKKLWFWESPSAMARRYGDEALVSRLKEAARAWRREPASQTPT